MYLWGCVTDCVPFVSYFPSSRLITGSLFTLLWLSYFLWTSTFSLPFDSERKRPTPPVGKFHLFFLLGFSVLYGRIDTPSTRSGPVSPNSSSSPFRRNVFLELEVRLPNLVDVTQYPPGTTTGPKPGGHKRLPVTTCRTLSSRVKTPWWGGRRETGRSVVYLGNLVTDGLDVE